ncbi:MAG: hypothetical protein PHG85_05840, partial [Candidatus Altiarchaeota archaeon]|nr:hypothetical protein [Candidatus Altiarchaeota archaeon]
VWLEAEDLFGHGDDGMCGKVECSNGLLSRIPFEESSQIENTPGINRVWVRVYDDGTPVVVEVNGHAITLDITNTLNLKWMSAGEYNLSSNTNIVVNTNNKLMDAILLTTSMDYNPNNNPPYGNPRVQNTCIVGNYIGEKSLVAVTDKTASFSKEETMEPVGMNETVKIRVVVWTEGVRRPTTTTTTTPVNTPIECNTPTPALSNRCSTEFRGVYAINSIDAPATILCGNSYPITVTWYGVHHSDPNYWGFFLNNTGNSFVYVDSCQSMAAASTNTTYIMD